MKPHTTIREALTDPALLGNVLAGESWAAWRALLIAAMGEALTETERDLFARLTDRPTEPLQRVEELWAVVGRRGGKTRAAAVLAVYLPTMVDHRANLSPGERGLVLFLAQNQRAAQIAFGYAAAIFDDVPLLSSLVASKTADTLALSNGIDLEIRAASFRGLRGVTALAAIADELAFWYSDEVSANADSAILAAVRPALATTGGPLIAISSPYGKRGELYNSYRTHYGSDGDPRILVAQGGSRDFNPSLSQSVVDRALERDPEANAAEYLAQFRGDIAQYVSREAVEACVSVGVRERAPATGVKYVAFVDPSGGSSDSMTMCIGHREKDVAIIDCVRERKAPFSPDAAVAEFADVLKSYRLYLVRGDRYAGEWPRERFGKCGIEYFNADKVKSDIYLGALPAIMSRKVDLLDNVRVISQICGLERSTGRGKDTVDHRKGARDDLANSVLGVTFLLTREWSQDKPLVAPIFLSVPRTYFGDANYTGAVGLAPHLDRDKRDWPVY
jgi:hypothetical protein